MFPTYTQYILNTIKYICGVIHMIHIRLLKNNYLQKGIFHDIIPPSNYCREQFMISYWYWDISKNILYGILGKFIIMGIIIIFLCDIDHKSIHVAENSLRSCHGPEIYGWKQTLIEHITYQHDTGSWNPSSCKKKQTKNPKKQGSTHSAWSLSWVLMPRRLKERGYQQPGHWAS